MTAPTADALVPGSSTAKHQLSNEAEVRRLHLEWSVRAQIERDRAAELESSRSSLDSDTGCGATPGGATPAASPMTNPCFGAATSSDVSFIARRVAPGKEEVERAVRVAGHDALCEEELALLVRRRW